MEQQDGHEMRIDLLLTEMIRYRGKVTAEIGFSTVESPLVLERLGVASSIAFVALEARHLGHGETAIRISRPKVLEVVHLIPWWVHAALPQTRRVTIHILIAPLQTPEVVHQPGTVVRVAHLAIGDVLLPVLHEVSRHLADDQLTAIPSEIHPKHPLCHVVCPWARR